MLQVKPMVDEFSAPLWKSTCARQVFVEIVGVTENDLILVTGVNRARDELVMLGVITGFDVRLRINPEVGATNSRNRPTTATAFW